MVWSKGKRDVDQGCYLDEVAGLKTWAFLFTNYGRRLERSAKVTVDMTENIRLCLGVRTSRIIDLKGNSPDT
jgi:hypothetical protein